MTMKVRPIVAGMAVAAILLAAASAWGVEVRGRYLRANSVRSADIINGQVQSEDISVSGISQSRVQGLPEQLSAVAASTNSLQTQVTEAGVDLTEVAAATTTLGGRIDGHDSRLAEVAAATTTIQGNVDGKVAKAGDTMVGALTVPSPLTVGNLVDYGATASAAIRSMVCAVHPAKLCRVVSLDDFDQYISTGSTAGQFRNGRLGIGP